MGTFKLTEVKANLFHVPQSYSLAHVVSADFDAPKGSLAWQFATIFGQFDELSKQQIEIGNMAVLENNSRFIYFLVTKENIYEMSTYDTIQSALICMREHMRNHELSKVAMPRIGCGEDHLNWKQVRDIIFQVFAHEYNCEILVCDYDAPQIPLIPRCDIVEVKGNLFSAPNEYSLVHSVSADFAMCSGIGLQFKCKFGQVNELIKQNKHTGNVAVLRDNDRYIYNLITKERNHEKCTYPTLYYALAAMREHMYQHGVRKLAIPRLGCGLDRLSWMKVKKILELVFGNDNVEIVVYLYNPPVMVTRKSITTVHSPSFIPFNYTYIQRTMASEAKLFKLTELEGDLFSAPETHSLAHCVGADFVMGAGIAVKFKQIYGQVDQLLAQGVQSGGVAVIQDKRRYIYYLVTKAQSSGKPTYQNLHSSLTAMRKHMCNNNVNKLAIPRLGCGIDGLEWDKVCAELHDVFGDDDLEIVVYNFVPK